MQSLLGLLVSNNKKDLSPEKEKQLQLYREQILRACVFSDSSKLSYFIALLDQFGSRAVCITFYYFLCM